MTYVLSRLLANKQVPSVTLYAAARRGHLPLVKFLHEKKGVKADIFALQNALEGGNREIVRYLLESRDWTEVELGKAIRIAALYGVSDEMLQTVPLVLPMLTKRALKELMQLNPASLDEPLRPYLRDAPDSAEA